MAEKQHYPQQNLDHPPPYTPGVYPNLNQQQQAQSSYPTYAPNQIIEHQTYQGHTIIVNKERFGPFPTRTECPLCKSDVVTETFSESGLLAYLLGGFLCVIGCSLGCCLIPCCMDSTRDVVHRCPSCNQNIAIYKRL